LREIPMEFLKASFGPFWSIQLKKLSYGEDDSFLTRIGEIPKAKSVSRTFTLYQNTTDLKIIKATLRNLCEEAAFKARQMKMKGREIGVAIKGGENGVYLHKTLKYFIDDGGKIFEIIWRLFGGSNYSGYVRFLGIWLGSLKPKETLTIDLFPQEKRRQDLIFAMDRVNGKYGELTLYPGILLQGKKIKSEVNGFLGDKSFRFANEDI